MLLAFTRAVPFTIHQCELTHVTRAPIDYARAVEEHDAYESALEQLGCRVERLPDEPQLPDSVFVEDTAVVFDAIAVIARPGAPSRRGEIASVAAALARHRPLAFIESPATLDGGDVLATPRGVFVGVSARTNEAAVQQLAAILSPAGITVTPVPIDKCLHLKSAVSLAGEDTLLLNPEWVDPTYFGRFRLIDVDPAESAAANVLLIGPRVLCATDYPRTRDRLEHSGISTLTVAAAELAKAEGGLTCCSLIVDIDRESSAHILTHTVPQR